MKALEDEYDAIVRSAQDPALTDDQRAEVKAQLAGFEAKYYQAIKNSIVDNAGTCFGLQNLCDYYSMYTPEEIRNTTNILRL